MSSISTLQTENPGNTFIKLLWEGDYDYVVVQQSLNNVSYTTIASDYYDSSYTATGLTPNTLYYFKILPYDSATGLTGTSQITFSTTTYSIQLDTFTSGIASITSIPLSWTGYYYKTEIYGRLVGETYYSLLDSVIGSPSCVIAGLDADSTYQFYAIAYNMYDLSSSTTETITASTDYTPYIDDYYLENNTATTLDIQWTGQFSFVTVQKSTDGGAHYTNEVKLLAYDSSGSTTGTSSYYTVEDLTPNTEYVFRLVPYSKNYNVGDMTDGFSGSTVYGLTAFAVSSTDVSSITLAWTGIYPQIKIYHVFDSFTVCAADITGSSTELITSSYQITDLIAYTTYEIYVKTLDENGDEISTSDSLYITTNFTGEVAVETQDVEPTYITFYLNTFGVSYPYYTNLLVQCSTDATATKATNYTDISYLTQNVGDSTGGEFTYDVSGLAANTYYYMKFVPFGLYGVSGTIITLSNETLPLVYDASTLLYVNSDNELELYSNGEYKTTEIQYSTTAAFSTYATYTTTNYYPTIMYDLSSSVSYYFRVRPYNKSGVAGYDSVVRFNPVITQFYISDVSTNKITLSLAGKYEKMRLQRAGSVAVSGFADVSTNIVATSFDISYSCAPSVINYYRLIPYYSPATGVDISGRLSDTIFVPAITSVEITDVSYQSMTLTWVGIYDSLLLQYRKYTDASYTDLSNISVGQTSATTTNTLILTSTEVGGDFSANSFDFRLVPYSVGSNTTFTTTGLTSSSVYNPVAVIYDTSNVNSYSITLLYTSNMSYGRAYYKESTASSYTAGYIELGTDSSYVKISGLYSNRNYDFRIYPYDENGLLGSYVVKKYFIKSMFDAIDLSYNTGTTSIYFFWKNSEYYSIEIYKSTQTNSLVTYKSSDNVTSYTTTETLSTNTAYSYKFTAKNIYGSEESVTKTVYTEAEPQIKTAITTNSVKYTWNSSGYNALTIQNTTLGSTTVTYDISTASYFTASNETVVVSDVSYVGIYLLPNTQYTYAITYSNTYGETTAFSKTINTSAACSFVVYDISYTSMTLRLSGNYTAFKVYLNDSVYYTSGNVITAPAVPDIYYYPFDANTYNYNLGFSDGVALDGSGGAVTTASSAVSGSSMRFVAASGEYLTLPAFSNSSYTKMTLAFWTRALDNSVDACIFDISGTNNKERFYISAANSDGSANMYYSYYVEDIQVKFSSSFGKITDGSWTHLAITFDSEDVKWYVYKNGVLTETLTSIPFPSFSSTGTAFRLGGRASGGSSYNGYVEDFRMYSSQLTASEIANLVARGAYDISLNSLTAATTYSVKVVAATTDLSYSVVTATQSITTK